MVRKKSWPADSPNESAMAAGMRSQRTPVDSVTEQQYLKGWDLISTGHSIGQVLGATGLTRPQLDYLTRVGHPKLYLDSYTQRLAEISTAIRRRAQEAAEEISLQALDAVKREAGLAKVASSLVGQLLQSHIQHVVIPAQKRLTSGSDAPAEEVASMAMPAGILSTLRTLREYTKLEPTARMFRTVFDSPKTMADQLGGAQVARVDLSAEQALPAAFALVEDLADNANPMAVDPLDLQPEWQGWTLEEIEAYMETGQLPAHAFGDVRVVGELPEECLDQSADD